MASKTPPPPPPAHPGPERHDDFFDLEEPRRRRSFWRRPIGVLTGIGLGVGALVFVALVALGLAIEYGYVPDNRVVPGEELPARVIELLRKEGILEPDERPEFFYSAGLRFLEDGNLFSRRRVISYWSTGDELEQVHATFEEITRVDVEWAEDWLNDTVITIGVEGGSEFLLLVATEDRGDRRFHARLCELWKEARERR